MNETSEEEIKKGLLVRVIDNSANTGHYESITRWPNWKDVIGKVLCVTKVTDDREASDGCCYILDNNRYRINFYRSGLEVL